MGWVMVFCAHLLEMKVGAGTKITPIKIITERGGGFNAKEKLNLK